MSRWIQQQVLGLGGLGLATFLRNWMRSLRYECALSDPRVDPTHPQFTGPAIFIFWHEYIPFMFYLRGNCDIAMLVSRHRDAVLLSEAAGIMGFDLVRGSTRKGAVGALRGMMRRGRGMNLTLTPDGPKGPRRHLAPGCLYLSSRLEIPLVPLGLGYDRPWRNRRAWDHFAIPRPWSRACAAIGAPIQIPPRVDRTSIEDWRKRVERLLNQLTWIAETSATSGVRMPGARATHRQAPPLACYRTAPPIRRSPSSDSDVHQLDGPLARVAAAPMLHSKCAEPPTNDSIADPKAA